MPLPTSAAKTSCFHSKKHEVFKHFWELSFDAAEESKPIYFVAKSQILRQVSSGVRIYQNSLMKKDLRDGNTSWHIETTKKHKMMIFCQSLVPLRLSCHFKFMLDSASKTY